VGIARAREGCPRSRECPGAARPVCDFDRHRVPKRRRRWRSGEPGSQPSRPQACNEIRPMVSADDREGEISGSIVARVDRGTTRITQLAALRAVRELASAGLGDSTVAYLGVPMRRRNGTGRRALALRGSCSSSRACNHLGRPLYLGNDVVLRSAFPVLAAEGRRCGPTRSCSATLSDGCCRSGGVAKRSVARRGRIPAEHLQ